MNVHIQTQGFSLTPAISARVRDRLHKTMERYVDDIMSIDVFLKDLNGPKGGEDKTAVIRVRIRHLAPIAVTTTRSDLYKAIDESARRARRSVRRIVRRKWSIRRRGLQYVAATSAEY